MIKKNPFKWLVFIIAIFIVIGTILLIYNHKEQNSVANKPHIFETVNDQLNSDVKFTNGWKSSLVEPDENGGKYIIVQVGSLKNDPKQGIAVVCHQNKNSKQYIIDDTFLTPTKHGAIKVESLGAKDFNMSVVANDGYKWNFNIYNGFSDSGN